MKTSILTVKTVTVALKAKKELANRGIKAMIVKLDSDKNGCQYGIKFYEQDYYDVISVLRESGTEYGVHKENDLSR